MGKKTLKDLYKIGLATKIPDGDDYVEIWIQKLTQLEAKTALKKANAARSRVHAMLQDSNSDEYRSLRSLTDEMTQEQLVEYMVASQRAKLELVREAELIGEEKSKWGKNDYLEGLREAWEDGMSERYHKATEEDPDPEAQQVFEELKAFSAQVDRRLDLEMEKYKKDLDGKTVEVLCDKIMEQLQELQCSMAWVEEFKRCEVWLCTRDPEDHNQRLLEDRLDVDDLDQKAIEKIYEEYEKVRVDTTEGKDSEGTPNSSPSSNSSEKGETSDSSGPKVVAA